MVGQRTEAQREANPPLDATDPSQTAVDVVNALLLHYHPPVPTQPAKTSFSADAVDKTTQARLAASMGQPSEKEGLTTESAHFIDQKQGADPAFMRFISQTAGLTIGGSEIADHYNERISQPIKFKTPSPEKVVDPDTLGNYYGTRSLAEDFLKQQKARLLGLSPNVAVNSERLSQVRAALDAIPHSKIPEAALDFAHLDPDIQKRKGWSAVEDFNAAQTALYSEHEVGTKALLARAQKDYKLGRIGLRIGASADFAGLIGGEQINHYVDDQIPRNKESNWTYVANVLSPLIYGFRMRELGALAPVAKFAFLTGSHLVMREFVDKDVPATKKAAAEN